MAIPHQQLKGLAWLVMAISIATVFAIGLPFLANLVPWSVEKHASVFLGGVPHQTCTESRRPEAALHFQTIVRRLYPLDPTDNSFPVTVDVIAGPTVNAFAGLGGHIYVYEGLIKQAESPEELAGVLAHEIEHVRRRHILQGLLVRLFTTEALKFILSNGKTMGPQIAGMLLHLRFSRDQETEADIGGLKRLHEAHIDPTGFVRFFERQKKMSSFPALLSDHPSDDNRAELARQYQDHSSLPIMSPQDWASVKTICQ